MSVSTNAATAGGYGSITYSSFTTTVGLQQGFPTDIDVTYAPPSAPQQTITFARQTKLNDTSNFNNSGAGHIGATLSYYSRQGTGNPNLAIAHESKFENLNAAGTITFAKGQETQLAANAGTIASYQGNVSQVLANAGTITTCIQYVADCPSVMAGTVGTWIGFHQPNITGNNPVGSKISTEAYAFKNDDPQQYVLSAGPVIDAAVQVAAPSATGFTVTVPHKASYYFLYPSGTAISGAGTINLDSAPLDGQEITLWSNAAITTITMGFGGKANYGTVTAMVAFKAYRFKYFAALTAYQLMA